MKGGFRSRSKRTSHSAEHNAQPSQKVAHRDPRGESHARRRRGQQQSDLPREVALSVIRAVRVDGAFANLELSQQLRHHRLSKQDAAFATELANGTVRARGILDPVIEAAAGRSLNDIDGDLLDVLRLGAYQLLRTRVPAHAAVSTSTELARGERGQGAAGFVNAVLRQISRRTPDEWQEELAPSDSTDPLAALAFHTSHPTWIAEAFADALGVDATDPELSAALAADDERPIVHLVALPGSATAEEIALITGGEQGTVSPYAVHLTEGGNPGELSVVKEGLARVQDEGSQVVACTLVRAPIEGNDNGLWLDLCAGPGGKAALLGAEASIAGATVVAVEPQEHRAELVSRAVSGLPVSVVIEDGRTYQPAELFDRVLVDTPCSGLGSLRRRPESRWTRESSSIEELTVLQRELLIAATRLVRPGGVVVYSTCSPHVAETREIVESVAAECGMMVGNVPELWPGLAEHAKRVQQPYLQLWPHIDGTDAMFVSILQRPVDCTTDE